MLLDRRVFLVKEQVSFLKLTDKYDIFDPETGDQIGTAQEQISTGLRVLRLLIITITRGFTFLRSKVNVIDEHGSPVGYFQSKLFSLGGGFTVHNPAGEQIADVKGNWKGWDFQLSDLTGNELGRVKKKWAGAMKEIFTSADNYVIELNDSIGTNRGLAALLLAAGLAIDIVFKEKG